MDIKSKQLIIDSLSILNEITNKINSYQVVNIDLNRVIYFLTQFENSQQIEIIIRLLSNLQFLDSSKITHLLKKAYEKIEPELLEKPLISSLGGIQDSSAVVCYQLLKQLFDSEENTLNSIVDINSLGKYIEENETSVIILFDDNITSGTQLYDFFTELIKGKDKSEFFKNPITPKQYEIIKQIPIRICYAIQLSEKSNEIIDKIRKDFSLDIKIHVGKVDYDNYLEYGSNIMHSEEEEKFSKKFIKEISTFLYEDKKWSTETVYSRVLGYGNLGKLTVFYYNVPKSLIPIFWKFGFYKNKPWFPLFPETQEQKKIIKSGEKLDFMKLEAIESWVNSSSNNRKPKINFGILINEGIVQSITLQIPSRDYIRYQLLSLIFPKKIEYIENKIDNSNRLTFANLLGNMSEKLKEELSYEDYEKYKKSVDKYNEDLEDFFIEVEEYIFRFSSNKSINLILNNNGNIAASNPTVKLYYNTGQILMNEFFDLKKPKFSSEVPNINDFSTSSKYAIITSSLEPFQIPSLSLINSKEPFIEDTDYVYKIDKSRLGHNDNIIEEIELTRMNLEEMNFEIQYEINYDEEPETLSGFIKINYEYVETIGEELKKKVEDKLKDFKKILQR
ncbi:hypothetical protein B0A78_08885 [Flavobacterium columnare NBRC 100251 = ATCC 23463]|uniref:phosphoribosyltransferase-like protein n=1 Tax=Flavobacterium columnare TaxID=996 RepID=UPI0007F9D254|nr:hypothetical protein [Flavobacterium columnare]ANO48866.1 hypothetical protein Pf1_00618 [Flavobacterium columnare]APT23110.1 hypothetical protein BU993_11100 [Flavobacterium columnare]PDS23604.1 hypothetical protein B0A78_08885 [Flavobacterium columnare NBRC 100251 = ATCC 23463]QOG90705.1 hypothetical protein HUE41_12190 [Flavobacterium columnare]QOG93359.1 hypothetical protein HUE42_12185 [Flavobacterium columnare]